MSHSRLRKEKDCLNCGAIVEGRYCSACGQENVVPRQTLWHLITHFFSDVTHFDGKFFTTLKPLIFRPGFLSAEYVKGRRVKYLDPVRMYLFISAVFALLFISFNKRDVVMEEIPGYRQKVDSIRNALDSIKVATKADRFRLVFDSIKRNGEFEEFVVIKAPEDWKQTTEHYDSLQKYGPDSSKDGWFDRYIMRRMIEATHAYDNNPYYVEKRVLNNFYHSFSKLFFFSLPIFASLLWIVYIRRRKEYFYVAHAIFSIHYYCVVLIFWGVFYVLLTSALPESTSVSVNGTLVCVILLALTVYLYIAMIRFYKQGWFKTLVKFFFLGFFITLFIGILAGSIFFNSILEISDH